MSALPWLLQVLRLNLHSCFNILKPSVRSMMDTGGGSLVFCTSAVARHGIPNHEAIAAAKAGVQGGCLSHWPQLQHFGDTHCTQCAHWLLNVLLMECRPGSLSLCYLCTQEHSCQHRGSWADTNASGVSDYEQPKCSEGKDATMIDCQDIR